MVHSSGRITLWGIEAFIATADEGSVSAAARRLGVSPSGISQQLAGLEAALAAVLMDRSTRPVTLTPAGQMFRRRAQLILSEAQQAKAELAAQDLSALTDFRLGMIEDFDADVTPRLLSAMAEELRTCQFLLETGASHRLFDLLDTRALDMVVAAEMGAAADWMEVHPLLREPFVAAVPKGRIDAAHDVLAQLQALPLIQYTLRHHMGRQIAEHLARQHLTLAHRFELDSYHAILAMVAGGAGWTILTPLGYLRAQRFRDQVEILPLPFAPLSRTISLSARAGVLQDMPVRVAAGLRPLLEEMIVTPAIAQMPWLQGALRVL
ncbi:MAG: LysR family transcriptional regulator [Confluentimicrobium sp.]|jgi:DNA-binding transcriptional LysR family regulator|uniref:LysR family transcriptional regulator n=1 Tax=Actibacterium sp. TaxID=1872125 RepID=UPI00050E8D3B|nr:LysR family transcriptional regulator [Actibacterium sp.]KGB82730.1 LysR family transcriptional regulator [Rhodovulum sp. NI22]MBC55614.1 LysR family transcriptional regulator [Actibacterium sp.]MDY6857760.1 LysR family transcriptional regulator [Pseudomonadota bacterium]